MRSWNGTLLMFGQSHWTLATTMSGVILDADCIPDGVSKGFVRLPKEKQADYYNRLTHLHLQGQKIRQIGDLVIDIPASERKCSKI